MSQINFTIPIDLVMQVTDINEDEVENYVDDIMMAIDKAFYSDDSDDDHFKVVRCNPRWMKSFMEEVYDE